MKLNRISSIATLMTVVTLAAGSAYARPADVSGEAVTSVGTATGIGGTFEAGVRVPFWKEQYKGPYFTNLVPDKAGVPLYNIPNVNEIPRLKIEVENLVFASKFKLDQKHSKVFEKTAPQELVSPTLLTKEQLQALARVRSAAPASVAVLEKAVFKPKGKVSREEFDRIAIILKKENELALKPGVPLTQDEFKFLSALLLFQAKQCPSAIGVFHELGKKPDYVAEANYFLARCSKMLGLTTDYFEQVQKVVATQDPHYTKLIFKELMPEVPKEMAERFGEAMLKAAKNEQFLDFGKDSATAGNVYFVLASSAALLERYNEALTYSLKVPQGHPKYQMAQYLYGLSEYQVGSKSKALSSQEKLLSQLSSTKNSSDFQAMVALNLARMYFQENKFKEAQLTFIKVTKDKPLWLTSLTEMGWSQLQAGDYEGAIGNMYSIQSPFFKSVYKPDSYVIRTIGYLNLCQYGDAYKSLTTLEKHYRPWLEKVFAFQKEKKSHYQAVKAFLAVNKDQDFDGLPAQIAREMARHKDFINLQTALNRQVDEKLLYSKLDSQVNESIAEAKRLSVNSRAKIDQLKAKVSGAKSNPQLMAQVNELQIDLNQEMNALDGYLFRIDLYNMARESLAKFKGDMYANSDKRVAGLKGRIETVLQKRLVTMKNDLIRILDNNELLRYETFAGSGENIRYQVSGGAESKRVPASVLPQSKALSWQYDGEFWEDEIGHYRSTLKNNCPDSKQATLGGAQ